MKQDDICSISNKRPCIIFVKFNFTSMLYFVANSIISVVYLIIISMILVFTQNYQFSPRTIYYQFARFYRVVCSHVMRWMVSVKLLPLLIYWTFQHSWTCHHCATCKVQPLIPVYCYSQQQRQGEYEFETITFRVFSSSFCLLRLDLNVSTCIGFYLVISIASISQGCKAILM